MDVQAKARTVLLQKAKTGTPQIEVEFYVGSAGKYKGELIRGWFSLSPRAVESTKTQLRLMGWDGDLRNLQSATRNVVRCTVVENEFDGRVKPKVDRVWPLVREVNPAKELSQSEVDALQTLLSGGPVNAQREPGADDDMGDFAPTSAYGEG